MLQGHRQSTFDPSGRSPPRSTLVFLATRSRRVPAFFRTPFPTRGSAPSSRSVTSSIFGTSSSGRENHSSVLAPRQDRASIRKILGSSNARGHPPRSLLAALRRDPRCSNGRKEIQAPFAFDPWTRPTPTFFVRRNRGSPVNATRPRCGLGIKAAPARGSTCITHALSSRIVAMIPIPFER
jgi:hypothetical protein